jgi:serine/threonine protein kinase
LFPQTGCSVTTIHLPALPDVVNLGCLKGNIALMTEEEWEKVDIAIGYIEDEKQRNKQTSPRGEKTIVYSKKDLAEAYHQFQSKQSEQDRQHAAGETMQAEKAQESFEYSVVALSQFDHAKQMWRDYHFAIYSTSLDRGAFGKIEVAQARPSQQADGQPVWWVLKKQLVGLGGHTATLTEAAAEQEIAIKIGSSPRAKTRMRRSKSKLGEPPQVAYLMQFAPGCSIEKFLKREYAWHYETSTYSPLITPLVRLEVILQMMKEVVKLHQQNYVHGDIKAANFVVDWVRKQVKLVDYGATHKLDEHGQFYPDKLIGTSIHLSPELREQLKAHLDSKQAVFRLNVKTDAYALGVTIADFLHLLESVDPAMKSDVRLWGDTNYVAYNDPVSGIDGYHDLFLFNETLDKTTLAAVLDVVHHLVEPDEDTRWTVELALKKMNALKQTYIESDLLTHSRSQIRIGMIDINWYLKQSEAEREIIQRDLLDRYEEVVLFEMTKKVRSLNEYFYVLRGLSQFQMIQGADGNSALKRRGLIVHDQVFIGDDFAAIQSEIKKYVDGLSLPAIIIDPSCAELNQKNQSLEEPASKDSDKKRLSPAKM